MQASLFELLENGIAEIYGASDEILAKRLSKFYDEITLFNPTYALVNASEEELVIKHLLDCLSPAVLLREEVQTVCSDDCDAIKAADLGSGAGLPGLVLASAFTDWDFTLVERMGRRAGFLRNTLAVLGLSKKTQVLQKDLSEVQNQYNIITFRAFRAFKDIVFDLDRILLPHGKIFAYKSSDENIQEEIKTLETLLPGVFTTKIVSYSVPFCTAKRQLLILEK